jgi:hypothetical protein
MAGGGTLSIGEGKERHRAASSGRCSVLIGCRSSGRPTLQHDDAILSGMRRLRAARPELGEA